MRVGFITQLLWPRYGRFWTNLVEGVGAEAVFAEPERTLGAFQDERLADVPGVAFRLAAAQALALQETDLIVAPQLNPESSSERGGAQDPWTASFPEMLAASLSGLPPVTAVPASLGPALAYPGLDPEPTAFRLLLSLSRDPAGVKRVWERNRAGLKEPLSPSPTWERPAAKTLTTGLIAQPWLLAAIRLRPDDNSHLISQAQLAPALLREESWRVDPRLIATDAEVIGAARYLARRGSVERLEMIVDQTSGADAWLAKRIQRLIHKPLRLHYLQEMLPEGPEALLSTPLA